MCHFGQSGISWGIICITTNSIVWLQHLKGIKKGGGGVNPHLGKRRSTVVGYAELKWLVAVEVCQLKIRPQFLLHIFSLPAFLSSLHRLSRFGKSQSQTQAELIFWGVWWVQWGAPVQYAEDNTIWCVKNIWHIYTFEIHSCLFLFFFCWEKTKIESLGCSQSLPITRTRGETVEWFRWRFR